MCAMKTLIRYVLLTALRDRLFIGLLVAIGLVYGLAVFTGSTALSEQQAMSLALFAGGSRIVMVIGIAIFACFHVQRAFDSKEIESILAKPISRRNFLIGYSLGFTILAMGMVIPIILINMTFLQVREHLSGLALWSLSLVLEVALITEFALLAALILRSAVSAVLASLGFYIIARLMGFFIAAMVNPFSMMGQGKWGDILLTLLKYISVLIPRLDLFAKSNWLIYGIEHPSELWLCLLQAVIFILFLQAMAVFDLKRKQF